MQQAKARVTPTGAILMGAGGLIALIGSVLPWAKFSLRGQLLGGALSQSVVGTSTGEGKIVLGMAIVAIAAAVLVVTMPRRQLVMAMGIVVIVAALVVSFLTIRDIGQKDQQIHDALEKAAGRTLTDAQVQEFLNRFGITDLALRRDLPGDAGRPGHAGRRDRDDHDGAERGGRVVVRRRDGVGRAHLLAPGAARGHSADDAAAARPGSGHHSGLRCRRGSRTPMPLRAPDFESGASADSAIPALGGPSIRAPRLPKRQPQGP